MVQVILDPSGHRATIVNAGHMAPLHHLAAGKIAEPGAEQSGLPLGVTDAMGYEQTEIEIAPGDLLTLYTDGINESLDADGGFYTIERLKQQVLHHSRRPTELGPTIIEDVRRFVGKAPQNDDMCLVCFSRMG
jgi:serine phosphatase RsbU (regulator of sigma subunit)